MFIEKIDNLKNKNKENKKLRLNKKTEKKLIKA